jgi:hypothetical protein
MRDQPAVHVAIVSLDPVLRLEAARAFDGAPLSWDVTLHKEAPPDAEIIVATPEVDCPDAIRFDPDRPEEALDAVAARVQGQGRVVIVASAAGGVGTTTVALHLAALAGRSARAAYLDLDTRRTVADRLGLPPDARTWADVDESIESVENCAIPVAPGFRVLLAPPHATSSAFDEVVAAAARSFDTLIVDAPDLDSLDKAMSAAACGVLVVAPTIPCARRGREILSAHDQMPWAVVVNRTGPGGEVTRGGLQRILGCRIAVELPCCPSLRDREDEGRLLDAPWTRWARRLSRLYGALLRS